MAIVWPATVPLEPIVPPGVGEQLIDNKVSAPVERGPPFERLATAMALSMISFELRLTAAEWEDLEDWWRNTLWDGVEEFDIEHPLVPGLTISCVFAEPLGRPSPGANQVHYGVPIRLKRIA